MNKTILSPSPVDVAICNALETPTKGVHAGDGVHVFIPDNWLDLVNAGQDVPGCTYAKPSFDGSLIISDIVQLQMIDPQKTKDLKSSDVTAFVGKVVDIVKPVDTIGFGDVAVDPQK